MREKTTDARRRNHYDGGVLQARDDRPSEVRLYGVYMRAIHESPWRTSKRVVLVRVNVNTKAHTGCTTSSPTRYNLDHNLTLVLISRSPVAKLVGFGASGHGSASIRTLSVRAYLSLSVLVIDDNARAD